jgi:hypothetical protein
MPLTKPIYVAVMQKGAFIWWPAQWHSWLIKTFPTAATRLLLHALRTHDEVRQPPIAAIEVPVATPI